MRRAWMPGAIFKYLVLPLQHVAPLNILRKQANVERKEFDLFVSKILLFNYEPKNDGNTYT
jgi:hypothetical protein